MVPLTVDAYLHALPADAQPAAAAVRAAIRAAVPDATETIKYAMPAFQIGGVTFLHFAVWKKHIGLYPIYPAPAELEAQVAPLRAAKDTVQLMLNQPMPTALIAQLAAQQAQSKRG